MPSHMVDIPYWHYKAFINCWKIMAQFPNTLHTEMRIKKFNQNQNLFKSLCFILDTMVWSKNHFTLLSLWKGKHCAVQSNPTWKGVPWQNSLFLFSLVHVSPPRYRDILYTNILYTWQSLYVTKFIQTLFVQKQNCYTNTIGSFLSPISCIHLKSSKIIRIHLQMDIHLVYPR